MDHGNSQKEEVFGLSDTRLVHFLVVGTQKGGTTALADYLREHPDVAVPLRKELHFFDDGFGDGTPSYAEYHAEFGPIPLGVITGEATPAYMYWPASAARIYSYNPKARLIFLLRNPVERAYSHWNMLRERGRETLPFGEAIRAESSRLRQLGQTRDRKKFAYIERGYYGEQIKRFLELFSREQLLFIESETLKFSHDRVLQQICQFLGVRPFDPIPATKVSNSQCYGAMERVHREYLASRFARSIHELETLLGWDCSDWLTHSTAEE